MRIKAKKLLWMSAAIMILAACQRRDSADSSLQVFRGTPDQDGARYPALLRIMKTVDSQKKFHCSAVAIGGPYVLTASHCLRDTEDGTQADSKTLTLESPRGDNYKVKGFVADSFELKEVDDHQELLRGSDLALIRADRPITGETAQVIDTIQGGEVPELLSADTNGPAIEVVGFGWNDFSFKGGKVGNLHYLPVKYQAILSGGRELHLGESWKTTCNGDSGGSAFLRGEKNRLLGIVSRSYRLTFDVCGEDDHGHIVSNLAHEANQTFIRQAMQKLKDEEPVVSAQSIVDIDANDATICSGFVIAPTWVLTAAHCIYGQPLQTLRVAYRQGTSSRILPIASVEQPTGTAEIPVFLRRAGLDLALIQLSSAVGPDIPILPLLSAFPDAAQARLALVRYRPTQFQLTTDSNLWLYSSAEIIPAMRGQTQATFFRSFLPTQSQEIHAGHMGSICPADSGSPLILVIDGKPYAAGVQSRAFSTDKASGACNEADGSIYSSLLHEDTQAFIHLHVL